MEKKLLTEELYNMKYLFGYQRGVVVSEQKSKKVSFNWKGGTKGNVELNNPSGVVATNVEYKGGEYNMTSMTSEIRLGTKGKGTPGTPPGKTPEPIFTELELKDSLFPYPDNMVKPKFDKYPDAKLAYDEFINKIVVFLNNADASKLPNFTIQGTADSARPTLDVPSGYSSLDHSDTPPYAGETDPSKMNQYLADNRGEELGKIIIQDVLDKTGQDITNKIKYETGINYYGQQDKRGSEFRMVTVKPSSTEVNVDLGSKTTKTQGTSGTQIPAEAIPEIETFVDLRKFNGGVVPAKRLSNTNTGVLTTDVKNLGEDVLPTFDNSGLNGNTTPEAYISGDELFVGGLSFGKFQNPKEKQGVYDTRAESSTKYVTEGRPVLVAARDEYYYIRVLQFTLTELNLSTSR